MLMSSFFLFIILIGYVFARAFGDPLILAAAIIFSVLLNISAYWYSDKVTIYLSGAKPASREKHFALYTTVENLAITAGLPMPRVYVIEDNAPNAFATGRNKTHAVVAVTSGLLNMLQKPELEGVLAHELSHIGNSDILLSTVAVVLAGVITLASDLFLRRQFFGGREDNRGNALFFLLGIVLALLAPLGAMLIRLAISRKREFLADASGALLTRYPEGLATALEKINAYDKPLKSAHDATAHLYISNPFGAKTLKGMHKLFMTHPPVAERIRALRGQS